MSTPSAPRAFSRNGHADKIALVTGATRGIGFEIARCETFDGPNGGFLYFEENLPW